MRLKVTLAILLSLGAWGVQPVLADQQVKAEEIIEFFASAADQGAKRGICVGTAEECDQASPKPAGLDMLVNFNLDSADLTDDARLKLGEFAKALRDNRLRAHSFVVEGHTDASGSTFYNEELSQRRAQSVTSFLLSNGIEQARISAVGMGETHPRAADPYDPANRRVEMRISQ
jgi:outer membrane protein OmpA-like peptidoglycan-associated protein